MQYQDKKVHWVGQYSATKRSPVRGEERPEFGVFLSGSEQAHHRPATVDLDHLSTDPAAGR